MKYTKATYLIATYTSLMFLVICMPIYAKKVGEQPSPNLTGEPKGPKEVSDGKREPKETAGSTKVGSGGDLRPEKKTPVVTPPKLPVATTVVADPSMDKQGIIDALTAVHENQKNSDFVKDSLSTYVGGIVAVIDAVKWAKDINTLVSAQVAIEKFEMTMKPGEISHVLVSASPEGKVNIIKLTSLDAPVLSDGKSNSFTTTISAPNFNRLQDASKTEAQKQMELRDWFKSLDKVQRDIINEERRKQNLAPIDWPT